MSAATSPARVWPTACGAPKGMARSTPDLRPARRAAAGWGPKPAISDQALLVAIEADLEALPARSGLGFGSVATSGLPASVVLRLMRENNLLSLRPCRRGGNPHDGEIINSAPPHVGHRWRSGVHGGRRLGLDFTAVHWNGVCRLACLQARRPRRPVSIWLDRGRRGSGAGLADGSRVSDHFTNQIKFWGIQPSYAFVAEPQTNGVAERFNREGTDHPWSHLPQHRGAAGRRPDFVELYNAQWIVEKNGYLSAQARQAWHAAISIRPAA